MSMMSPRLATAAVAAEVEDALAEDHLVLKAELNAQPVFWTKQVGYGGFHSHGGISNWMVYRRTPYLNG